MSAQDLIEHLLELPDMEAQKRFLEENVALLNDQVADGLKEEASRFLRADSQLSLQTANLLLYLSELTGDPCHRALGLLAEANVRGLAGLGEYEPAIDLYNKAADIYEAHGRPVEQARSQIGKIYVLGLLSRYPEALEAGEWASRILEEHAQWRMLGTLILNLGSIHGRIGEDAEAQAQFERAAEIYRHMGQEGDRYLPWAEHNRAVSLRNLGRFEESIEVSQRVQELLVQSGQTVEAARAQQNLALTYFVLGRYNEALELLDQVLEVFWADGRQRDAILVELFISDCLLQLRRFADVLDKCSRIRARFKELGTRLEVGQALLNEAIAHAGMRRSDEAIDSLSEARMLFAQEENQVWMACADLEKAAIQLQRNHPQDSLFSAMASADVFQAHGLPVRVAQAHLIAGEALLALSRYDEATESVHQALEIAEAQDIPPLMHRVHHLLGSLALVTGDPQGAMREYACAIEELERLRGRMMVEFRADFLEDKQIVYEDAVCLCLDSHRPHRALEFAERAKSRALLDLLAYRLDLSIQARGHDDHALVEELVLSRTRRDRLYRRWEGREESIEDGWAADDASRQQARLEILAQEKQITELWHKLLVRNADYARDAALWHVRTEPVQPHLDQDTALLEYFSAHGRLVAFVVTEDRVLAQVLPGDLGQVQRLIQLLWLNLRAVPRSTPEQVRRLTTNAQGLLQQLYRLLVAPLAGALAPYPQLIVVPHGPLHYLPFHALYDGQAYLLARHELSYLPGASLLRYCREARPATSGLLAFGHSYGGRLPHTVEETQAVADLFKDRAYLEDEATLVHLRQIAPGCRAIHLATHGEFRPDNPLFSGLALADGWLTTLDIFNLRLNASLVTLSACQTGRNVVGGGDELLGLMRALLYAGAASLVLSLWAVEDRSTAQLMKAFYGKLAAGWTKGAALQHAQRQLVLGQGDSDRGAGNAHAHPYYWAPFCLVGDADVL